MPLNKIERRQVEEIIALLKKGVDYNLVIEKFTRYGQTFLNAEKYIEGKVLQYIEENEFFWLYDFIAKTCKGFPTFELAHKIAISKLTKKQFQRIYKVSEKEYERAFILIEKVPTFLDIRETVKNGMKDINCQKLHYSRKFRIKI